MVMNRPFLVLISLLAAVPALAQKMPAEGRREPVLTVLGKGSYETKPDLATFRVTVSTDGKTLEEAAKAHEHRATRAHDVLKGLASSGLEIEKSGFRLNERRTQLALSRAEIAQGKRPAATTDGFTAQTTFHLKLALLDNLNVIVSKIAEAGLFSVDVVRFQVAQERAALNQARRAAMLDAQDQALAYTEPVNLNLAQIISITDGEAQPPDGMADLPGRGGAGQFSYAVQIIPPAIMEFTALVNVTWRIEPR
jgi:uncharacterized protein YggE